MNSYQKHGYKDRNDYLSNAADEYGVDPYVVSCLADLLGENEDFDGEPDCPIDTDIEVTFIPSRDTWQTIFTGICSK